MTIGVRYHIVLLVVFFMTNVFPQELISQSPKLLKSVLTQTGSSPVSYDYKDETGVIRTTKIRQSIGQNGIIGLSKTSQNSVQQGFLNRVRVFNIDNTTIEFVETMDLIIYPNPFKDFVKIKFSKPTIYPIKIDVFDVRGRLVFNQEFRPSAQITVSMDRLEDASYIIRVSSGSHKFLKKLIKAN